MAPRARGARVSEKTEQAHIVQLLTGLGARVWVLGTRRPRGDFQGTRQTPGIPDLYAVIPHRQRGISTALWVECKAAGGRLRPEQVAFQQACHQAQVAHVVGGLDAVIGWLLQGEFIEARQVPWYRLPAHRETSGC